MGRMMGRGERQESASYAALCTAMLLGWRRGIAKGFCRRGELAGVGRSPPLSGSWKMLALGGIAQHPVGTWPAWPHNHPSSPQQALFPSWVVLILGNSQHSFSSIFCGILKAGAYFWGSSYPLCRSETRGDRTPCPLQRCCLGGHSMSSITFHASVEWGL